MAVHLVGHHEVAGPGGRDGGGVLAREEHRDQHPRDFMVLQVPAAVVMHVLAVYEHLH